MTTLTETFTNIADAIRSKNGSSDVYTPAQMPSAIQAIPTGGGTYQSKTVSPSESSIEVTADSPTYDALSKVTVNAISSSYVGSGVARKSSTDLAINGATVTAPAGYYANEATTSISSGSVTAPSSISGTSASVSTGTNTLTLSKTISVTPNVTTAGYISSGTAGNSSVSLTASINTRNSSSLSASGATVTAPAGYYSSDATKTISSGTATAPATISGSSATVTSGTNTLTLSKTVSVTPSVTAGYISSGTAGNSDVSLTASVTTKAADTITPGTTDQTIASGTYLTGNQTISGDANLVAGNIKSGTSIFGVTGTYSGGGSNPLKFGVLRPDAELIKTVSYDKYIVDDEKVSIPAYTTTASPLKASETLTDTVSLDLATYNYFVLIRMLTIPVYNTTTTAKGRFEWMASSCLYELADLEANTIHTLVDPTKYYTSRTASLIAVGSFHRCSY
jgi:hypothetical protein